MKLSTYFFSGLVILIATSMALQAEKSNERDRLKSRFGTKSGLIDVRPPQAEDCCNATGEDDAEDVGITTITNNQPTSRSANEETDDEFNQRRRAKSSATGEEDAEAVGIIVIDSQPPQLEACYNATDLVGGTDQQSTADQASFRFDPGNPCVGLVVMMNTGRLDGPFRPNKQAQIEECAQAISEGDEREAGFIIIIDNKPPQVDDCCNATNPTLLEREVREKERDKVDRSRSRRR